MSLLLKILSQFINQYYNIDIGKSEEKKMLSQNLEV